MIRGICPATFPLILLVSLLPGAQTAFACSNGKIIFEDKFQTLDPAWGIAAPDSSHSVGSDGLVYNNLDPNKFFFALSQTSTYDNYEVCAQFTTRSPEKGYAYTGVAFWAVDSSNYYSVDVYPSTGIYGVYRLQKGRLLTPVPSKEEAAIVKGQDVLNEISVIVNGNHGVVTLNGKKAIEFNGIAPDGGSLVGFEFGSGKDNPGPAVVTIKDFQVRALE